MPVGSRWPQEVKDEFFGLICRGESLVEACRRVGVSRRSGDHWWAKVGDMTLVKGGKGGQHGVPDPGFLDSPGGRGHRLSLAEREEIMVGVRAGLKPAEIARRIGRHRSVVCREVERNSNSDGMYYAGLAHARAQKRARRPKQFKLVGNRRLCAAIESWMDDGWSPGLIAAVLRKDYPDDRSMRVSHETIYQCLYVQTRGELRKDLYQQLSLRRRNRRPHSRDGERRSRFADAFTISQRPPEADDRAVPGHWEGDLIIGVGSGSAIGTLVERSTRFTLLLHLPGDHTADTVTTAMIAAMKDLPDHLRRSITWDRGAEIAGYERIRLELGTPVYLCNPHSPWQRGTNENTNRLLRHWFAKGTDLNKWTPAELKRVQDTLNRRPRPTLGLQTPAQRLNQLLLEKQAA
jgi:IS30 family transposase